MTRHNPELMQVLQYILKKAQSDELSMIKSALEARQAQGPKSIQDLNFQEMAKDMSEQITRRFGLGRGADDVRNMAKRLVTDLIKDRVPDIPEQDLQILVNEWTSGGKQARGGRTGKEELLPPEAIESMIDQFVRYSLQMMPEVEQRELKQSLPDWVDQYWNIFSSDTKHLIKDLLEARLDTREFWTRIHQKLDRKQKDG